MSDKETDRYSESDVNEEDILSSKPHVDALKNYIFKLRHCIK